MAAWYYGTSDYVRYLKSPGWQKIRSRIIKRDKGLCLICETTATHVHHHDYDDATMQGKNDDSLVSLCETCHLAIEFNGDVQRYDLIEKRKIFDQRRRDHLKVIRTGLCLQAISSTEGKWKRITFRWQDPALATQFSSMFRVLWKLMYSLRPNVSWGKKFRLDTFFTQKTGVKLYLKETKKVAAVLRLLDSGLIGEIRYRPEFLKDPLPELKRVLGKDTDRISRSKYSKAVQAHRAKITGKPSFYKIRIENKNKSTGYLHPKP